MQALLDEGARVDVKDDGGYTATDFARAQKQTSIVDLLMKKIP